MNLFRSSRTAPAILALIALTSAACVHHGAPKVGINKIEANLVFGVKTPDNTVAPVGAQVPPDVVPAIIGGDLSLPPALPGLNVNFKPPAKPDCPAAANTASAEKTADVNITGPPLQGVMRWKHSGQATLPGGTKLPFSGFENRVLRNFKQLTPTTSTFETLQPVVVVTNPNAGATTAFRIDDFAVNTAGTSKSIPPPAGPVTPPTLQAPDAGVVLTSSKIVNSAGSTVGGVFQPIGGVLLLPLPVSANQNWVSVAVDPLSGQTLIHSATVARRTDIDACGDLIEGWIVKATQVLVSTKGTALAFSGYDYMVATQYGGMLIDERLSAPDPLGANDPLGEKPSPYDLDFTLGQLKPSPIPGS